MTKLLASQGQSLYNLFDLLTYRYRKITCCWKTNFVNYEKLVSLSKKYADICLNHLRNFTAFVKSYNKASPLHVIRATETN